MESHNDKVRPQFSAVSRIFSLTGFFEFNSATGLRSCRRARHHGEFYQVLQGSHARASFKYLRPLVSCMTWRNGWNDVRKASLAPK